MLPHKGASCFLSVQSLLVKKMKCRRSLDSAKVDDVMLADRCEAPRHELTCVRWTDQLRNGINPVDWCFFGSLEVDRSIMGTSLILDAALP